MWILKQYVERCYNYANHAETPKSSILTFRDHAFGACELFMCQYPSQEKQAMWLWNEYRHKFDKLLYGA